jgi:hypothetical protein
MQKLYSFITIILLVLCIGNKARAQAGVGAMYIGDYSKMSSKDVMDRDMENGSWIYRLQNLKNNKYMFKVLMKNRSFKMVRSKIYADSIKNMTYLLSDEPNESGEKQRIYCNQTISITRDGTQNEGMALDSCWIFRIANGKINAYSFLSDADGPYSICAIQYDRFGLEKFTREALEPLVKNDTKAYKAFLKKEYLKAIEKYNQDNL